MSNPSENIGLTSGDLAQEASAINKAQAEVDQRREAVAAEQRRRLQAEHKLLVRECRSAKDEFSRLEAEAIELQRQSFSTGSEVGSAEGSLASHRASEPKASDYPTEEELSAWRKELKRREAAVRRANDANDKVVQAMLAARSARNIADENLRRLADKETNIRERLNPPTSQTFAIGTIGSPGITFKVKRT